MDVSEIDYTYGTTITGARVELAPFVSLDDLIAGTGPEATPTA